MKLFFIRHAQSVDDLEKRSQGNDSPLSELGKKQADEKTSRIAQYSFDAVYSSPYIRTMETAAILLPSHDIKTLDFIYEIKRPRMLEGGQHSNAVNFWEVEHSTDKYDPAWTYDGSESFNTVIVRARKLLDYLHEHHEESETIAIVSHGGFIRHFVAVAGLGDTYEPRVFFDLLFRLRIPNTGMVEVELAEKRLLNWSLDR